MKNYIDPPKEKPTIPDMPNIPDPPSKRVICEDIFKPRFKYFTLGNLEKIFNEWARRYEEDPEAFGEILDENGNAVDDYGKECAIYFKKLSDDLETK